MSIAKSKPFISAFINGPNYASFIREILQKNSVVSNAAIVVFTSSAAAVLPLLHSQQPDVGGGNGAVPPIPFGGLRNTYSAFVVCLMLAFACAFTSMVLLPKKPKASRLLNISAALCLSSAFTLLFSAIIRNYS